MTPRNPMILPQLLGCRCPPPPAASNLRHAAAKGSKILTQVFFCTKPAISFRDQGVMLSPLNENEVCVAGESGVGSFIELQFSTLICKKQNDSERSTLFMRTLLFWIKNDKRRRLRPPATSAIPSRTRRLGIALFRNPPAGAAVAGLN
jgi:hypothetical protein